MADDPYYPFDLGVWRAREEPMVCPKHGPQDGGLSIMVRSAREAEPQTRCYCGLCIIEALDRIAAVGPT
jgi:hypothetical protein